MLAKHKNVLDRVVTGLTTLQTAAKTASWEVTQVNVTLPDGSKAELVWHPDADGGAGDWDIVTR